MFLVRHLRTTNLFVIQNGRNMINKFMPPQIWSQPFPTIFFAHALSLAIIHQLIVHHLADIEEIQPADVSYTPRRLWRRSSSTSLHRSDSKFPQRKEFYLTRFLDLSRPILALRPKLLSVSLEEAINEGFVTNS